MGYFEAAEQGTRQVRAIPGNGTNVPIWILGSSLYGAQLAAHLGLPYAFASHFAPAALDQAVAIYRETFRPSQQLQKPYFMLAVNVFAGESDEEGRFLRSSMQQSFANLRSGRPGQLPRPIENVEEHLGPAAMAMVDQALTCSATGSKDSVQKKLTQLISRHQPDEILLASQVHDHTARLHSFEIAASILRT